MLKKLNFNINKFLSLIRKGAILLFSFILVACDHHEKAPSSIIKEKSPSTSITTKVSCSDSPDKLKCLERNFDALTQNNYDEYWEILVHSAAKARQCAKTTDATRFLGLSNIQSGNAEFDEFFSGFVEDLCLQKTDCLKKAVTLLTVDERKKVADILRNPLFSHDEKDFRECREKVFSDFSDILLDAEHDSTSETTPSRDTYTLDLNEKANTSEVKP